MIAIDRMELAPSDLDNGTATNVPLVLEGMEGMGQMPGMTHATRHPQPRRNRRLDSRRRGPSRGEPLGRERPHPDRCGHRASTPALRLRPLRYRDLGGPDRHDHHLGPSHRRGTRSRRSRGHRSRPWRVPLPRTERVASRVALVGRGIVAVGLAVAIGLRPRARLTSTLRSDRSLPRSSTHDRAPDRPRYPPAPMRDLRISVTDRCNFRCGYCMPRGVRPGSRIPAARRDPRLRRDRAGRGPRSRCQRPQGRLTGGEPLVRRGLEDWSARLAAVDGIEDLTLTTNSSVLAAPARPRGKRACIGSPSASTLDDETFTRMNDVGFSVARVLTRISAAERPAWDRSSSTPSSAAA